MRGASHSLGLLAVAAAAAASFLSCDVRDRAATAPLERPNVLLISIDSLRADHVGALGYHRNTTPAIDALANDGALFTRGISSTSWTLPAHAALMTGLLDSAHGVTTTGKRLDDSAITLAEAFASAGYRTAGFFGGPFLDPSFGFAQGFDTYVDCSAAGDAGVPVQKRHATSHRDRTNPEILWNVLRELEGIGEQPFFLFVHFWDVHYDLIPPPRYVEMFDPGYPDRYRGSNFRHDPDYREGADETLREHVLALYDGEVLYTDDTIAMLVSALRARGLLDRTLVVVTSDHGDELLDHGDKGHRHTLYQELIRIPILFRLPGRVKPRRVDVPVSITDVAPTILDLAGLEPLPNATGRSLARALETGATVSPVPVISELAATGRAQHARSIVAGDDKVIFQSRRKGPIYFDLAADPGERSPRNASEVERAEPLLSELDARLAEARELGRRLRIAARADIASSLGERLRSLGYVD